MNRYTGTATGGGGFNEYAVGRKHYGGGRGFPTMGPVDPTGYRERDRIAKARREAMLKRLRAGFGQNFASAAYLRDLGA